MLHHIHKRHVAFSILSTRLKFETTIVNRGFHLEFPIAQIGAPKECDNPSDSKEMQELFCPHDTALESPPPSPPFNHMPPNPNHATHQTPTT